MSKDTPFVRTRKIAEQSGDGQKRNKAWWESSPMTYVDWNNEVRALIEKEDFEFVNREYTRTNPFLQTFDFSKQANQKVLEVGCGAGSASVLFAKNDAEVTAVDLTEQAVAMTGKNAEFNNVNVRVKNEDAEKLSFGDETFDYVYSWGVLHHSENTENAFSEVARVLKAKGKGLIMVYNRKSIRYYVHGLIWLLFKGKLFKGDNFESVQSFFTDGYYHRHFSADELKSILAGYGLLTDKISITHMSGKCFPFAPDFIDEPLKRLCGWLLVVEFTKSG